MSPTFQNRFECVAWVLSTGRTGTMALARCLDAAFPHVLAVHEPHPSRHLRIASNRYLCRRISAEDLIRLYTRARRRLFERADARVYIESNNFLHGFLDVADRIFHKPLILHVVRDPRTFIPSWINHGVLHGVKGLVGHWHPWWLLKPDHHPEGGGLKWRAMRPVARLAWFWTAVNRELDRGESLLGARYLRIRFEDLFFDDGATLARLLGWLELPPNPEVQRLMRAKKYNAGRRRRRPPWNEWPEEDRRAVLDICGPLMEKYGYPLAERPGE